MLDDMILGVYNPRGFDVTRIEGSWGDYLRVLNLSQVVEKVDGVLYIWDSASTEEELKILHRYYTPLPLFVYANKPLSLGLITMINKYAQCYYDSDAVKELCMTASTIMRTPHMERVTRERELREQASKSEEDTDILKLNNEVVIETQTKTGQVIRMKLYISEVELLAPENR